MILTLLTHRFAIFDVLCQMIRKSSKPRFFDPHVRLDLHDRWRLLDDIVRNIERHSRATFKTVYKLIVSVERSVPVDDTFDVYSSRCWDLLIIFFNSTYKCDSSWPWDENFSRFSTSWTKTRYWHGKRPCHLICIQRMFHPFWPGALIISPRHSMLPHRE